VESAENSADFPGHTACEAGERKADNPMNRLLRLASGLPRALPLAVATGIVLGGGAVAGCGNVAVPPIETPPEAPDIVPFASSNVDKVDILLMIDNSRSMADKQQILAFAVPDLLGTLLNPKCLDGTGLPTKAQPSGPLVSCPPGAHRAFSPITDIHVGIVTSSLGSHGADTCSVTGDTQWCPGGANPSNNDGGHLIARQDACGSKSIPTYENKGFLAWDPAQRLSPPGEAQAGAVAVDGQGTTTTVTPGLLPTIKDLVDGVGQIGCGFPSQLESWYRFLVDPDPYQTIAVQQGKATPQGTDTLLLKQRADFLRPSSLLSIVMLTDSNDCSIRESGQFYFAAQQKSPNIPGASFHLPRARQECAKNPGDPCCKSCGQSAPNCPVDDTCAASPTLDDTEDPLSLRCFDQKRRFGIDFLYPIERYTNALQSKSVPNRQGDMVPNPLFADLNPADDDESIRGEGMVFLAGIVGVPWQALARDPANPDKGFLNSDEMQSKDENGASTWDRILGDPQLHVPPTDPHMIESVTPRPGLPGPASPPGADPINGHEYTTGGDDLQYACVFGLPAPRDCSAQGLNGCDCSAGSDDPSCDPATPTTQVRANAYPGLRELATLKSMGSQGLVASICPVQLTDSTRVDYGYRLALQGITDRLKPVIAGQCLPRQLTPDEQGLVSCSIIEATKGGPSCVCDPDRARRVVPPADQALLTTIKASSEIKGSGLSCFCELVQAGDPVDSTPEELAACEGDLSQVPVIQGGKDSGKNANGWCYVDPSRNPASNDDLVKSCPETEKRAVRFVGDALAGNNALLFVTCSAP
jgi:hypothetical protein